MIIFGADGIAIYRILRYYVIKVCQRQGNNVYQDRFEMFVSLTGTAMKSIQRIKAQKMKKYGLTSAHTNCICRLESAGENGLTQMQIVRLESVDPSQISRVLHDLMDKGYVQINGEEGRYRRRYSLTDEGIRIAHEIREIILEINDYVSHDISGEDIEQFYGTFKIISDRLIEAEKNF